METKNPNAFVLDKLKHLGYEYYDLVPPVGHGAGGLALFWKQEIKLEVIEANANLIDTQVEVEGKRFLPLSYMETQTNINEEAFGTT